MGGTFYISRLDLGFLEDLPWEPGSYPNKESTRFLGKIGLIFNLNKYKNKRSSR